MPGAFPPNNGSSKVPAFEPFSRTAGSRSWPTFPLRGCKPSWPNSAKLGKALPPLPEKQELFTRDELAALLALKPLSVYSLVRRHRLPFETVGTTRSYPRETATVLHASLSRGRGPQTSNYYLREIKSFCSWMVRDRRMADNPLAHLQGSNARLDLRHDRRALSAEELTLILEVTMASRKSYRGLSGEDRYFLYLAAMTTGFRSSELASLTPASFVLDAEPPTVVLAAGDAKNKRTVTQPLPEETAQALRGFLAGKAERELLWPGAWPKRGADMLRMDLEAAGIPYVVEGPDGPLYADFHALRHSFIAMLDRGGVTLKQAMQLARHSDPKLTMARYGRAQLHDLAQAVGKMPSVLTPATAPAPETGPAPGQRAG